MTETAAARAIQDTSDLSDNPKYDAACKRVLSIKSILSRILKGCIPEYKDCSFAEIENCIEDRRISEVSVLSGSSPEVIRGSNVEDKTLGEKQITFDILFRAKVPGSDDALGLIINIEAQKKYTAEYPMDKRQDFYVSRMVSAEHDRDIGYLDYQNLKRVYSIWVFTNPPEERVNTISWVHMTREFLYGHFDEPEPEHVLHNIIDVHVGEPGSRENKGLLRMLSVLFAEVSKVSLNEKKRILNEEFGIPMTYEVEGGVTGMCNLSEGIFDKGRAQGRAEGEAKGRAEGEAKKADEVICNMLAKNFSIDVIAEISGKTLEYIQKLQSVTTIRATCPR